MSSSNPPTEAGFRPTPGIAVALALGVLALALAVANTLLLDQQQLRARALEHAAMELRGDANQLATLARSHDFNALAEGLPPRMAQLEESQMRLTERLQAQSAGLGAQLFGVPAASGDLTAAWNRLQQDRASLAAGLESWSALMGQVMELKVTTEASMADPFGVGGPQSDPAPTQALLSAAQAGSLPALEALPEVIEAPQGLLRTSTEFDPEAFSAALAAVSELAPQAFALADSATRLSAAASALTEPAAVPWLVPAANLALVVFALVMFGAAAWLARRQTTARLAQSSGTNARNQEAILRLLDELEGLADGDLTTTVTVSEDFTGAIADSINFTIERLRRLVASIHEISELVSGGAQDSSATARQLAEASEHQAQEIAAASDAINRMARSIDQVSAHALESAQVAERSVAIAKNGTATVRATTDGMDNIRDQIQETAKRIKRLGESSQEIGDILALINDIADQTNILALNAAIQASMAGDAGRGFAVVADEVQRLAERSGAATKQIEVLVRTIQSDTNEAVLSMEQTTAEVVRGAGLAENAGVALEEIEGVSSDLAGHIQGISQAANQQAESAGQVSNTMRVIQEITAQTSSGTSETASAIGELTDMAHRLRQSVAGFKLPAEPTVAGENA